MTNIIDVNGLQLDSLTEEQQKLITAFTTIYGTDINIDSNTPDGQLLGLFSQQVQDLKEFITSVYNSFDPDTATGINLDKRVSINNIQRRAGTYTITDVTVTTDSALNLEGLDGAVSNDNAYTIQDANGNKFYLLESQTIVGAGAVVFSFRAVEQGEVLITQNTLTTPVTVVAGVVSVNNPTSPDTTGINEETDAQLRAKRTRSFSLGSVGFIPSMYSGILALNGIEDVLIVENVTSATDSDGIPPHSYWIIVRGSELDASIADVIYEKRSGGTDLKGSELVNVTQVDGTNFLVKFDRAISVDLYIQFEIELIDSVSVVDKEFLKTQIVENIFYTINQTANKTRIESFVKSVYPTAYVKDLQVSINDSDYFDTLEPATKQNYFVLDEARIDITDV